eukprot:9559630-Karenia_brevis.AAC.1
MSGWMHGLLKLAAWPRYWRTSSTGRRPSLGGPGRVKHASMEAGWHISGRSQQMDSGSKTGC